MCVFFSFDENDSMLKIFVLLRLQCCGEEPCDLEKGPRFGCTSLAQVGRFIHRIWCNVFECLC